MLPVNDDKTEELAQLVHEHIVRQSNLTADTTIKLSVQQWLMMTILSDGSGAGQSVEPFKALPPGSRRARRGCTVQQYRGDNCERIHF